MAMFTTMAVFNSNERSAKLNAMTRVSPVARRRIATPATWVRFPHPGPLLRVRLW